MSDIETNETWRELAAIWAPYFWEGTVKLTMHRWISDDVSRASPPILYDENDMPVEDPPMRTPAGRNTDFSRAQADLRTATSNKLRDLRRVAATTGDPTPPNWFEMTLWRDGRYEMSFTYSAEAEARYASPPNSTDASPDGPGFFDTSPEANRSPQSRPIPEPDSTASTKRERGRAESAATDERALIAENREMARENLDRLFEHPDDPRWLERFLYTHVSMGTLRIWEEARTGLARKDDGSTRVFQDVRWEGRDDFEPLPIAEPQWLIDALEHTRARQGESGERRRDLTVHLTRDSMRLEWGAR